MYFIRIYLSGTQHNNTIQYNTDILGALSGRTINKEFNTMISCLPMVGGSLRLLPPLKLVAMI
jgi:hypothetical protein